MITSDSVPDVSTCQTTQSCSSNLIKQAWLGVAHVENTRQFCRQENNACQLAVRQLNETMNVPWKCRISIQRFPRQLHIFGMGARPRAHPDRSGALVSPGTGRERVQPAHRDGSRGVPS